MAPVSPRAREKGHPGLHHIPSSCPALRGCQHLGLGCLGVMALLQVGAGSGSGVTDVPRVGGRGCKATAPCRTGGLESGSDVVLGKRGPQDPSLPSREPTRHSHSSGSGQNEKLKTSHSPSSLCCPAERAGSGCLCQAPLHRLAWFPGMLSHPDYPSSSNTPALPWPPCLGGRSSEGSRAAARTGG